ncbi:hypothetical protein B0H16DRAFT_1708691 [Mycena metata]|uniref:Uncharacterized protein n=1 Tax=Mycena metata TaxID=1033252 RepID=A0AAD7KIQ0_9AGAR|nr:hypothetical protein B0H16DRAFT_1708691 [Mycena metata]
MSSSASVSPSSPVPGSATGSASSSNASSQSAASVSSPSSSPSAPPTSPSAPASTPSLPSSASSLSTASSITSSSAPLYDFRDVLIHVLFLYDTHGALDHDCPIYISRYFRRPDLYDNCTDNVDDCCWINSRRFFNKDTSLTYGCYRLAFLVIVAGVLFWIRRRSRYKSEFDGNFDPARVTGTRPVLLGPGMVQTHATGGTLPRMDIEDDDD